MATRSGVSRPGRRAPKASPPKALRAQTSIEFPPQYRIKFQLVIVRMQSGILPARSSNRTRHVKIFVEFLADDLGAADLRGPASLPRALGWRTGPGGRQASNAHWQDCSRWKYLFGFSAGIASAQRECSTRIDPATAMHP